MIPTFIRSCMLSMVGDINLR